MPVRLGVLWAVLTISCVRSARPDPSPALTAADIVARIPAKVADREGWARDLVVALETNRLPIDEDHVCAVLAVVEQESGYHSNPEVPNLAAIARKELAVRAEALGPLASPLLNEVLSIRSPKARLTFDQRLSTVRTEADLDLLYRDLLAEEHRRHPLLYDAGDLGAKLFSSRDLDERNPITTSGSMQVSVRFSEDRARALHRDPTQVRDDLYTRQGGLLYGSARLFTGATDEEMLYRFADYNAGEFSSRNAELQAEVASLSGTALALDGDLLSYDKSGAVKSESTQTMAALAKLRAVHGLDIALDARHEKSAALEKTPTWHAVKDAWTAKHAQPAPYARLPDVKLESPKLSRDLSTAWFAHAVERHYDACRVRASRR